MYCINNDLNPNIIDPNKTHPYYYHFKHIDWKLIGTLTWKTALRRSLTERAEFFRKRDFHDLLNATTSKYKIRLRDIAFYRTLEFGDAMQGHYHFLIANQGLEHISSEKMAETMNDLWKRLYPRDLSRTFRNLGIGTAVIEPYNENLGTNGVKYCTKREINITSREGSQWELERIDYISPALKRLIICSVSRN